MKPDAEYLNDIIKFAEQIKPEISMSDIEVLLAYRDNRFVISDNVGVPGAEDISSIYMLWRVIYPRQDCFYLDHDYRGAKMAMARIKNMYDRLPDDSKPVAEVWRMFDIGFDNNSYITCRQLHVDSLRGQGISLLIINDLFGNYPDICESLLDSVMPVILEGSGRLIISVKPGEKDMAFNMLSRLYNDYSDIFKLI